VRKGSSAPFGQGRSGPFSGADLLLDGIREELGSDGFAYVPRFAAGRSGVGGVAHALGWPAPPSRLTLIETDPAAEASRDRPFDRPESIGWHNDFSTHARRPSLTLAYIDRADPGGPMCGAWRVASCTRVLDKLNATTDGRTALRFLTETPLPYSFAGDGEPLFFHAIEDLGAPPGRLGLRFYGRAMRDGARLIHGVVPADIERAIRSVEVAADEVGVVLPAAQGALLVTDNWHCLHDRLAQTVDRDVPLRRALLCFVERYDKGARASAREGSSD
jgi:hypothetical protein